jgi:RNA polymerase sigma-70 factor, ECF subfamily
MYVRRDVSRPALAAASDRALTRRLGLGDASAFEELFRRHFASTFSYALRMLDGDGALAQDATQEAWTKVWLKGSSFQGSSKVRTWLFTIVAREVTEIRRRSRPVFVAPHVLEQMESLRDQPAVDGAAPRAAASAEASVLDRELWSAMALALSELPWRQRATWLLREHEGMSYDEIAEVLRTSNTVVRGQLHRAKRALAIRMEQWR